MGTHTSRRTLAWIRKKYRNPINTARKVERDVRRLKRRRYSSATYRVRKAFGRRLIIKGINGRIPAVGSRAKVMHGNAKHTSGGLHKDNLKYNKWGRIVSVHKSNMAKASGFAERFKHMQFRKGKRVTFGPMMFQKGYKSKARY